jgi:hypothetical protein
MIKLDESLPDWSKTVNPNYQPSYAELKPVFLEFLSMSVELRRTEVATYSHAYCFPKLNLAKASGLYLLLRGVFELPREIPRGKVQVFGGWLHPSIGEPTPLFDLSWPITVEARTHTMRIHRFTGYSGREYLALDEYDYFAKNFPFRAPRVLEQYSLHAANP